MELMGDVRMIADAGCGYAQTIIYRQRAVKREASEAVRLGIVSTFGIASTTRTCHQSAGSDWYRKPNRPWVADRGLGFSCSKKIEGRMMQASEG